MPIRVVSTRDQQPITVNSLVAAPLAIPERIIDITKDQFVMDRILRDGGTPKGGVVMFRVSSPLFADTASEIVNEGGEIPVATVTRGDLQSKPTVKQGLAVVVTREMRDRDQMGEVERQIQAVRNTLIRDIDGKFVTTLRTAVTQTTPAGNAWSLGTATIRKNINAARSLVTQAQAPSAANSFMGFRPDTLLIHPTTEVDLLNSTEFQAMVFGSTAASNVATLAEVGRVLGLDVQVSPSVADDEAFVLQAKTIGFYADEVPLESTELYEWKPSQVWRSDTVRTTVGGIDQPLAGARITGV